MSKLDCAGREIGVWKSKQLGGYYNGLVRVRAAGTGKSRLEWRDRSEKHHVIKISRI